MCIHLKQKNYCKDCNGASLCSHGKRKDACVDCDGVNICPHFKYRNYCADCKGVSMCSHGKRKAYCKDCGGSQICTHGNRKSICKECQGSQLCIHARYKSQCIECKGKSVCLHNRIKRLCKECQGSGICLHGKIKTNCKECKGTNICEHNVYRINCIECKGSKICIHGLRKTRCHECDGRELCNSCKITTSNSKYKNHCLRCYIHLFPDEPITKNYKTKEKTVVDFVIKEFPDFDWISDKKVKEGCSKRRPDLLLDLGYQIVIIEIDENQHNNYDSLCENKRLMEISQDLGHRPIVFIRFNPDDYINESNEKIKSCWSITRNTGICIIKNKKEWTNRLEKLKEKIQYFCMEENKTEKTLEIIHIFYNETKKE